MVAFLCIIAALVIVILLVLRSGSENPGDWIQFFAKGKEAGFSMKELEQLRQTAISCNIQEPASIFISQDQMEICVRAIVRAVKTAGETDDAFLQDFLSKLFDYCKKIEMTAVENKVRISSSKQIAEGQTLKVLVPGTGVYQSTVIKNTANNLTIARPVNKKMSSAYQWQGTKISVYFWRENDAGYVFDTQVIDEVYSKGISSIKIEHNEPLFRTQKRKSMRIKLNKSAYLYIAPEDEAYVRPEKQPGVLCMIEDISESGCAFKINGEVAIGTRYMVQLALSKVPVYMSGSVRSVDYNSNTGISVVRMQADPLPQFMRNHILSEVFQFQPDDDDDDELPFRVLEEEIAGDVNA